MSLPLYQYRPLESDTYIRLLELHPAANLSDPLEIDLIHIDREDTIRRSDPSRYEAVSYCWGDPQMSHSLTVDAKYTLEITKNVEIMLRYLRSTTKPRFLWVDAICLNQQDNNEKEVQVPLMGRIYAQAHKVRIWLGEAGNDDKIASLFTGLRALALLGQDEKALEFPRIHEILTDICGRDCNESTAAFFSRPWFGRRWVLQEAVMANHLIVHCGLSKLDWRWFTKGTRVLHDAFKSGSILSGEGTLGLQTVYALCHSTQASLLDLLWDFHSSKCSVPHDIIYAMLGMARDTDSIIGVDYSVHWAEVFTRIATAYFKQIPLQTFRHLLYFGSLANKNPTYPSWVPNWKSVRSNSLLSEKYELWGSANFRYNVSITGGGQLSLAAVHAMHVQPDDRLKAVRPQEGAFSRIQDHMSHTRLDFITKSGDVSISHLSTLILHLLRDNPELLSPKKAQGECRPLDGKTGVLLSLLRNQFQILYKQSYPDEDLMFAAESVLRDRALLHIGARWNGIAIGPLETRDGDILVKLGRSSEMPPIFELPVGLILRPVGLPLSKLPADKSKIASIKTRFLGPCIISPNWSDEGTNPVNIDIV
ncbi:heterokaryon incompatibility protein-domain-containing protein [Clohesyomyces aquaticus]|uniref:Heterokaryon incompatibility protein-domain-containing protein n=1 Tax=Clohesyomyces aquaticus TaxID=1231657 RepID=A0A1Y1Z5N1_9PLEO|nr:heterokaryon incompatibility protein-domain-containing protein [Clohesyomyces aquaticus]